MGNPITSGIKVILHEDNTAMMRVVEMNRNPTMKRLHRVHGIAIAFLHEQLADPVRGSRCNMVYTERCRHTYKGIYGRK